MSDMSNNSYTPYPNSIACALAADNVLNSLQHQAISKGITDSAGEVLSQISATDKNISQLMCQGDSKITDSLYSTSIGTRDAIERTNIALSTNLTTMGQYNADRARDIQSTVERTSHDNSHTTERNASMILQAIERNAGETRYSATVNDATTRQANNDLARDIISQTNRGVNEIVAIANGGTNQILTAVERNGTAGVTATTAASYETRTLVNSTHNALQSVLAQVKENLSSQSSAQYASMLLEQQKVKECLAKDLAESKYEALKNKESLSSQMAIASCEAKYEALKNTQMLSSQLAECCCEIKGSIKDSSAKLDDTIRTIDSQRIRDKLSVAQNDINLLKVTHHEEDIMRSLDKQRLRDTLGVAHNEINMLKIERREHDYLRPGPAIPYPYNGYGAYPGYGYPPSTTVTQIQVDPQDKKRGRSRSRSRSRSPPRSR